LNEPPPPPDAPMWGTLGAKGHGEIPLYQWHKSRAFRAENID
jgi:hypothetical protein